MGSNQSRSAYRDSKKNDTESKWKPGKASFRSKADRYIKLPPLDNCQ